MVVRQAVVPVVSVIVGLIAFVLTANYWKDREADIQAELEKIKKGAELVDVIVARKPLPRGAVLKKNDLAAISAYRTQVGDRAVEQKDYMMVLGRKTLFPIGAQAPLFWTDIEGGKGSDSLSSDIIEKMRAISISVSGAASVSGMVRPTDRVDVLGTFTVPSKSSDDMETITLTLLQDVTILATGDQTAKTASPTRARNSYSTVTLQVTPREAEWLVFTQQMKGRLTLSLRNPSDGHYETELPKVDFNQIESTLEALNTYRQTVIRGNKGSATR